MKRIGLTGGIASGKSTVCRMLREKGVVILDADLIAHEVIEPAQACYEPLVRTFGREILDATGRIDRRRLGPVVFDDPLKLELLNRIVHPEVRRIILGKLDAWETLQPEGRIIVDASVMIESGFHKDFHFLVVVTCRPEQQLERLTQRSFLSELEARKRLSSQIQLAEKVKLADFVIDNSGPLENTRYQVDQLLDRLGWVPLPGAKAEKC